MTCLKMHMNLRTNGKRHQCDICDKMFNIYSVVVVHKRIHFGEFPYKCVECETGFVYSSHLKTHYQIHKQQNTNLNFLPSSFASIHQQSELTDNYLKDEPHNYKYNCKKSFKSEKETNNEEVSAPNELKGFASGKHLNS